MENRTNGSLVKTECVKFWQQIRDNFSANPDVDPKILKSISNDTNAIAIMRAHTEMQENDMQYRNRTKFQIESSQISRTFKKDIVTQFVLDAVTVAISAYSSNKNYHSVGIAINLTFPFAWTNNFTAVRRPNIVRFCFRPEELVLQMKLVMLRKTCSKAGVIISIIVTSMVASSSQHKAEQLPLTLI